LSSVINGGITVCLHVRDSDPSQSGDSFVSLRSNDCEDYIPAIKQVVDAGGWVVRLGDRSASRMPNLAQLIDYAHADQQDWIDFYLLSTAKFIIATNSGPMWAAGTFGVPVLYTNAAPIVIQSYFKDTITLPQLVWSDQLNRLLSFEEQMQEPVAWIDTAEVLVRKGYKPVKNTPLEIVAGVEEMLSRLSGDAVADEANELRQRRYKALLTKSGISGRGQVGRQFLQVHEELIP